jgi:hypothetical protein
MSAREVNISELLAAGREGRQLLTLAQIASATFYTDERNGQQAVWAGDNVILHRERGKNGQLAAQGSDLVDALRSLFRTASIGSPLIESKPLNGPPNLKVMFRHKEGEFKI